MGKLKKICAIILVFIMAFTVTPESVFAAKKVKLNKTKATVYVGKTVQLRLKNNKKKVRWSTSNKKVARVSKKGKVTGKKKGKATVTAKIGKKKYKCKIIVKKKAIVNRSKVPETTKPVEQPTTKPIEQPTTKPTIVDGSKLNNNDKEVLKKIIKEQKEKGADVEEDIKDSSYEWDANGNLIGIKWFDEENGKGLELKGKLDLTGLKSLKYLDCDGSMLTNINISDNNELEELYCNENQ